MGMRKQVTRVAIALMLSAPGAAFAYNPYCPSLEVPWLNYLPVYGPAKAVRLHESDGTGTAPLSAYPVMAEVHFDADGNITSRTDPDGTSFTYTNSEGHRRAGTRIDPSGNETHFVYTVGALTPNGLISELVIDVTSPTEQYRRVLQYQYSGAATVMVFGYTYAADGSQILFESYEDNDCHLIKKTAVSDDAVYYYSFRYDDRRFPHPPEPFEFSTYLHVFVVEPSVLLPDSSVVPHFEYWMVESFLRDERFNPVFYELSKQESTNGVITVDTTIYAHLSYDYY